MLYDNCFRSFSFALCSSIVLQALKYSVVWPACVRSGLYACHYSLVGREMTRVSVNCSLCLKCSDISGP